MSSSASPAGPEEVRRRKSLGKAGEALARRFLESQGFRILWANYRRRAGEIDIVARKRRLLVFCEVKSLVGLGDPREGYGEKQRRRLVELSEQFLTEYADLLPAVYDVRYDLIIVGEGEDGRLAVKEHVPDAFRP